MIRADKIVRERNDTLRTTHALFSGGAQHRVGQVGAIGRTAITRRKNNRQGTILIVVLGIMLILAGLVVTMGRSMGVEATASANYSAAVQAGGVERGAEQYVIAMLIQLQSEGTTFYDLPDSDFAAVKIGNGYFWIIRPNYPNDPEFSQYGLVDEAAKLNLNSSAANEQALEALPGMTQDLADAILDWRGDGSGTGNSAYYGSLPTPYQTKAAPFETVEELLLVDGFTRELLYGQNIPGAQSTTSIGSGQLNNTAMQTPDLNIDPSLANGIADYLTVYSAQGTAATSPGGTGSAKPAAATSGGGATGGAASTSLSSIRVNLNDAPREVLVALMEGQGLPDSDADSIIAARNIDDTDTSNVQQILGGDYRQIANLSTGQGFQYSADIVAVSGNGRAFKRVKIIVDTRQTTPTIIYRRDLTDRGWPLDPEILSSLRNGQPISDAQDISQAGSSM